MRPISFSAEQEIFKNQFLRLYSIRAEFANAWREYFVTEKGTRVGVLLVRNRQILLVRQYRLLIDDYSWEIPGGGVDAGETPVEAAIRECREEAGVLCHALVPLFDYRLGLDVTDSRVRLFLGTQFSCLPEIPGGGETDAREWVPLAECLHRAKTGEVKDLMTITAVLFYNGQQDE